MSQLHNVNLIERGLIIKDLKKLIQILSKFIDFDSAILFGSFFKSNKFNDIDILLIKNADLKIIDFINLYKKIIEINDENIFKSFYLAYYDSEKKPKNKIKISLELDSPFLKESFPDFYESVFFENKSFEVIYGNFNPNIYLDKKIIFDHERFLKYRELIKFLHKTPTYPELMKFCENKKLISK
ncbi:MAG: hypothetical protein IH845_02780 [Nanoarchaeota archaeon]|nr:hypothetical protein [Nanoarchaeota archaeon]